MSGPVQASIILALSRTDLDRKPSMAIPPQPSPEAGPSGKRARVALKPKSPQLEAGIRTEPPPSDPCAIGTIPAATAAPDPPEDPPAVREVSHGFRVGPS